MRGRGLLIMWVLALSACGQSSASPGAEQVVDATNGSWRYGAHKDEMRGTRSWTADNVASNQAELGFPYEGGTSAMLQLYQGQDDAPDNQQAVLVLSNGQIECGSLCYLSVKFDDGPVFESTGTSRRCGEDECVNVHIDQDTDLVGTLDSMGFHKRLANSSRMTIEVPVYNYGPFQYSFDTSKLVWPQPGAPVRGAAAPERAGDT